MSRFMLFKNETRLGLLSVTDLHRLMNGGGLVYRGIHHIPREKVRFELPGEKQLSTQENRLTLESACSVPDDVIRAQCISRWA
jgi:hypothetical protein